MIRVMIVDDEPLAREALRDFIQEEEDFQVVAEAGSGEEALGRMKRTEIDVVFLDIAMPGLNGLEVAASLAEWEEPPLVVFATAYDQYAIQAFEANAIDYLLKPYEPARLEKTFGRIRETLRSKGSYRERLVSLENDLIQKGMVKRLVGHRRGVRDRVVFDPEEVYYFHAEYTEVHAELEKEALLIHLTLRELLGRLDPTHFAQTHRAYLVNLDKVEKVTPLFSGNFEILLKGPNPHKIPLSRRYARKLKTLLGNW